MEPLESRTTDFLRRVGEIARIVHDGKNSQDVLSRLAYAICFDSPWKTSSIMAIDAASGKSVEVAHFSRLQTDRVRATAWDLLTSPTSVVLATGEPLIINDALSEKTYFDYWADAQIQRYRTIVLLPLRATDRDGRPLIMSLHSHEQLQISGVMMDYLSTCADLAGMAVEKGKTLESRDKAIEKLSSVLSLQRGLVAQALRESSFETLVQLCQRHLPNPFIIADLVVGHAYCAGFEDNNAVLELCNGENWEAIEALFRERSKGKFDQKTKLRLGGGTLVFDVLSQPIVVDGEVIGGIALAANAETSQEIIETAEAIWTVLSIALLRNHIRFQANKRSSSEFLLKLLEGKLDTVDDEPRFFGQTFKRSHTLVAIHSHSKKTSPSTLMWSIERLINSIGQHIMFGLVGQSVVLLVSQNGFSEKEMHQFLERLLADADRLSGGRALSVEIPNCISPDDYVSAWRRGQRLIDWALKNDRYGRLSVKDAGAFGILSEMLNYSLVEEFCHSVLGSIRHHDDRHTAILMPTLELLVKHGGRPQPVANDLNVHITTVRYRMQKLDEVFDIDVRDAETRFRVEMALRLSQQLPAIGSPPSKPLVGQTNLHAE